jgi:hypothetical protein
MRIKVVESRQLVGFRLVLKALHNQRIRGRKHRPDSRPPKEKHQYSTDVVFTTVVE